MISRKIKLLLMIAGLLGMSNMLIGQTEDNGSRPAYLNFSLGGSRASFIDRATSPLEYAAWVPFVAIGHTDLDIKRTSAVHFSYNFGSYSRFVNRHFSESKVQVFQFNYLELFQLPFLSKDKFHFKWGAQLNMLLSYRENEGLLNNSKGLDIIGTLSGVFDVRFELTQRQYLSSQVHIGLLNSAYRNGFAYMGQGAILNNDAFFDGYEFKLFTGYRLGSTWSYGLLLQNRNVISFSYQWDALTTGEIAAFQLAHHTLSCTFWFNLK